MSWTRKSKPRAAGKYLLAPWRWSFISKGGKHDGCLFCRAPQQSDEEALICWRGRHFYAILNKYPYTSGHLMIAPFRHLGRPDEMPAAEASELWEALRIVLAALDGGLHPEGYNLGMNIGRAAGAGIADHFHLHVVPRWTGDANFMPVACGTSVASYDLPEIFRKLRAQLA